MPSPTKLHNPREGDRSEYLAVYLLSKLGLVTQVPRQEDIGIDLFCNISNQESGTLTFGHHYAVSIKSESSPKITLEPPPAESQNPEYTSHIDWLFGLGLPLMLAVINKEETAVSIYSTLPTWFLLHERRKDCGIIELVPRIRAAKTNPDVGRPVEGDSTGIASGKKRFLVDLGYPIITLSIGELGETELLRRKKSSLRLAVDLATQSARYGQMHTPFFWWFNMTIPGGYVEGNTNPDGINGGRAWFVGTCSNSEQLTQMMGGLAPGCLSAALLFERAGRSDLLEAMAPVLKMLPPDTVFPAIRERLKPVFTS